MSQTLARDRLEIVVIEILAIEVAKTKTTALLDKFDPDIAHIYLIVIVVCICILFHACHGNIHTESSNVVKNRGQEKILTKTKGNNPNCLI